MIRKLRRIWKRELIRPMVHMTFTRVVLCLTAALLWNEFVNIKAALPMRTFAFLFLGIFLLVMGWMAYLRLDGIKMPTFDKRLFERKRKPNRFFGDMIDHVDEYVISFDDLENEEKDFCRLTADALCGVIFLLLSLL